MPGSVQLQLKVRLYARGDTGLPLFLYLLRSNILKTAKASIVLGRNLLLFKYQIQVCAILC